MKKPSHAPSSKYMIIFGVIFTAMIVFGMLYEWVNPSGGFLSGINNSWSNLRRNSPAFLGTVFSDTSGDYSYSFGSLFNKPGDERIVIAAIDDHTLSQLGYPFPRKYYGKMISKLNKLGAKTIVMDVFTIDPDRRGVASDREYVRDVAKAGNVSSILSFDRPNHKFQFPIKGLSMASRYMAIPNMDLVVSNDNMVRKIYLFDPDVTYAELSELKTKCPVTECGMLGLAGLAPVAYAVYSSMSLDEVYSKFVKIDSAGNDLPLSLNFRYPRIWKAHPGWKESDTTTRAIYRHISMMDILEGKLSDTEKAAIKGGVVFVGSTAIGAFDHYPSPFMLNLPGVEIHANALDNMINGDFLRPINYFLLGIILVALIWVPIRLRNYSISVITYVVVGIVFFFLIADVYLLHKLYEFAFGYVAVCIGIPFVFVTVYKALAEGQEKKWIKSTFGQYLSPKVVELVTKDPSKLSLGGEKRDMTAFFLDLAGFTTMSEKLSAEELTAMLVEYLSAFTDEIMKHDGTVDKYIGDCVVAFWNAPMDQPDHRKLGVLAAIDCQTAMTRLNESLTQFEIKPKCRVGVNSGPMVVGNMGSKQRLSYTVMGDSVNMASRMEGANKFFASKIMTSEHTFEDIKEHFDYRYLGSIRVVGKAIPTKVYEPFARKGEAAADIKAMLGHYNAGQEKFYAGDYEGAIPHFKAALEARPGDGPSDFYLKKSELFAKEPIKDWDQSFNLTEKG